MKGVKVASRRGSLGWGLLFALVPIFGVGVFLFSLGRWWLPPNVSSYGHRVDDLFYLILWITAVAFVLTEVALFIFLILYREQEGRKSQYIHGQRGMEILWTVVPGLILVFIAFTQKSTWDHIKDRASFPEAQFEVGLMARQFEWSFRYAGDDGELGTDDDIFAGNQLHVPVEQNVVVQLTSLDVLHSFFLPHLRLKQDAVPGMTIPVWFRAIKTTKQMREELGDDSFEFEIACAELCGLGHYRMRGTLTVETPAEVQAWLDTQRDEPKKT